MTQIQCECTYCGYTWVRYVYTNAVSGLKCTKCGDKNIRAKRYTKIDTYGDKVPKYDEEDYDDA